MKRAGELIYGQNGVIRRMDNLGVLQTPHKISIHNQVFREAQYFIYKFDVPPTSIDFLKEEFKLDSDVIRASFFKVRDPEYQPCSLEDELKPPMYRADVKEMIKVADEKAELKKPWTMRSGITYYPFMR